jgi:heme exporter protein D
MDTNLLYILIATGVISVLTLVYVIVDENLKQRRYDKLVAERKEEERLEQAKDPAPDLSAEADGETSQGSSAEEVENAGVEAETAPSEPDPPSDPGHSQAGEATVPVVEQGDPEPAEIAAKDLGH